jgi:hypothetical protein
MGPKRTDLTSIVSTESIFYRFEAKELKHSSHQKPLSLRDHAQQLDQWQNKHSQHMNDQKFFVIL